MDEKAEAAAERVKQTYRSFFSRNEASVFELLDLLDDAMILVEELERIGDTTPDSYPEPYCPHCESPSCVWSP